MATIYTCNGQVIREAGTGKWFIEPTPVPPPSPIQDYVTIGSQTWMSKNLAVNDGQGGIYTQTVNYGQGEVVEYYYTWEAAVRVAASIDGWHLPSPAEWDTLASTVGGASTAGKKLKSTYGWNDDGNGTNDYDFAGFPSGRLMNSGTFLANFGNTAYFWTSTERTSTYASAYRLLKASERIDSGAEQMVYGETVRLVKDAT